MEPDSAETVTRQEFDELREKSTVRYITVALLAFSAIWLAAQAMSSSTDHSCGTSEWDRQRIDALEHLFRLHLHPEEITHQ